MINDSGILRITPFPVPSVVARLAKDSDVNGIKAKIWMRGPGLYMVKVQQRFAATPLTGFALDAEHATPEFFPRRPRVDELSFW